MSRDPLEEQEADPFVPQEPYHQFAERYPLTGLLRKYNALPPEERRKAFNPVLGAPYNLNSRRITANGPLGAPYGQSQEGLWGYSASTQAGDTFGVQINKDALPYKPDAIYASFARSAFPYGMSTHKKVSYVKSAVRIVGSIVGIYAFGTHPAAVAAFFLLGIAEVIGVIEEQFENE